VFIQHPTRIFAAWLKSKGRWSVVQRDAFNCGRLAMALEIVTQMKSLEGLPVVSDLGRQEAIAAMHQLLQDNDLDEIAYEWYDYLALWRKPTFEPDAWQPDTSPVLPGSLVADASPVVEQRSVPSHSGSNGELGGGRLQIGPAISSGRRSYGEDETAPEPPEQ
jgi:hypothetical protein